MLTRRPLSLRARLAGMMAMLFVLGMLALYVAARGYGRDAADRSFDRLLAGSAISITESISITGDGIFVDIPYAALDMLTAAPDDRVFYRVSGPRNVTLTGYGDLPAPAQPLFADEPPSDTIRFFDAPYRGEQVRFALVAREIAMSGASGWVWVQVGQTRRAREEVARETVVGALAPIAAMTLLALAAVWFGIDGALRPLRRIGDDLAQRAPSDLQAIDTAVPAELSPLVEAMNGFMRRLADNIETLKAFIADASHQMRTPLAALLAQAQVASHARPGELRRSLEAIDRNGARLAHLLNQLLSDATIAHRADMRRFAPIDLLEAVQEAIRECAAMAEGSDVRLRTALTSAPLMGDRLMIVEALKNLIHNALRHGSGDVAPVELSLDANDGGYVVEVADRGPGIPPGDRERIFDRFARVDAGAAGAGIGLSIARRAVESHGGTIAIRDRPGGGLLVLVCLGVS